jgi:hypothetical protein
MNNDLRGLPPNAALLPGRLRIVDGVLLIDVPCDQCGRLHTHGWPSAHPTASEHRGAHCHKPGSLYRQRGYFITPGTRHMDDNREVLRRFLEMRPDIVAALAGSGEATG